MPKLGTAYVVIRASLGPLKKGLKLARSTVLRGMRTISATIKTVVKKIYTYVKRALLVVTAAVIASIYAFTKFEKQMANVSTMLDDHTMNFMTY